MNKKGQSWFGLIFVGIVVIFLVIMVVTDYSKANYCKKLYPSEVSEMNFLGKHSENTYGIKKGFIECCRDYYDGDRIESECKIFKKE